MRSKILAFALAALFAGAAHADAPFQFAAPNLRAPNDPDVSGLRFSVIHGRNQSVRGADFGMLSLSETGRMTGVAFIGGVHRLHGDMDGGATFSVVNHHSGTDSGLNHAFVNLLQDPRHALNVSFFNLVRGESLVDLGGVNVSKTSAAQIGFVNVTDRIETFQFGFLNMADNGFLPIFPVFNFPVD